jgi:GMP synthase-like glutamine amidotransferase
MARSIGILVTGAPPEELTPRYPHYGRMAEELLRDVDPELRFRHYDVRAGDFPSSPRDHDGWLITGSRHGAYEDLPWILRLAEFVRALDAARQPLIGICFGHQLIARALGGEVVKAPQGWGVGVHEAAVLDPAPWMDPEATRVRMVVSHQDQVTRLPAGAGRIAGSGFCPIAMYRVGEHVFAMQAHPEFTRRYSRELMEVRRELIGDERIEPGIASLASEVDSAEVARWMARFLNRAWTG